jgi:hypothetical protein
VAVNEPLSDEEWIDVYADQRGLYDAFSDRLEDLLETLLDEEEIAYAWVLSFSVHPDSLEFALNKARRDRLPVDNPVDSRLRVAGVAIGIETQVEAAAFEELVTREFVVDPAGSLSIDEAAARNDRLRQPLGLDTLAYEYPYYLVALDERRLDLPEWSRFAGLKVRIELRTLLQDAWRGIDGELPFVVGSSYPAEVRDLLARSALALSAVDGDLAKAKETIERLLGEYDDAVAAGDLQLPVNGISLLAYLRTSELVRSLTDLGRQVGLAYDPEYSPGWQVVEQRPLWLLRRADVHTIAELEDFLQQATPRARETLGEFARVSIDRGFTPWSYPEAVVEWLWIVLNRADAETISLLRYHDAIAHALNTLIGNPVPADAPDDA